MPYRYANIGEGVVHFHVYNAARQNTSLFRTPSDYTYFVRKLHSLAAENPKIEIVAYFLSRDRFHLVIETQEVKEIARYIHRLSVSYVMHFNSKYSVSNKLFRGTYNQSSIETADKLALTVGALHRAAVLYDLNPATYPWSSYIHYLKASGKWLHKKPVFDYFLDDSGAAIKVFTEQIQTKLVRELLEC